MAPTVSAGLLTERQNNQNNQFNHNGCDQVDGLGNCYTYSRWDDWGRWVALAVIVFVVVFAGLLCSCYNNRRRRRRGATPMYGTGWMPGGKPQGQQYGTANAGYYQNQPYNGGAPPPKYSPPIVNQSTGDTFNSNDGYYGSHGHGNGQQSGIELQPPQHSYQPARGSPVYEAPMGAPPSKGDGIIR